MVYLVLARVFRAALGSTRVLVLMNKMKTQGGKLQYQPMAYTEMCTQVHMYLDTYVTSKHMSMCTNLHITQIYTYKIILDIKIQRESFLSCIVILLQWIQQLRIYGQEPDQNSALSWSQTCNRRVIWSH